MKLVVVKIIFEVLLVPNKRGVPNTGELRYGRGSVLYLLTFPCMHVLLHTCRCIHRFLLAA